jgi:hypothetical protein
LINTCDDSIKYHLRALLKNEQFFCAENKLLKLHHLESLCHFRRVETKDNPMWKGLWSLDLEPDDIMRVYKKVGFKQLGKNVCLVQTMLTSQC